VTVIRQGTHPLGKTGVGLYIKESPCNKELVSVICLSLNSLFVTEYTTTRYQHDSRNKREKGEHLMFLTRTEATFFKSTGKVWSKPFLFASVVCVKFSMSLMTHCWRRLLLGKMQRSHQCTPSLNAMCKCKMCISVSSTDGQRLYRCRWWSVASPLRPRHHRCRWVTWSRRLRGRRSSGTTASSTHCSGSWSSFPNSADVGGRRDHRCLSWTASSRSRRSARPHHLHRPPPKWGGPIFLLQWEGLMALGPAGGGCRHDGRLGGWGGGAASAGTMRVPWPWARLGRPQRESAMGSAWLAPRRGNDTGADGLGAGAASIRRRGGWSPWHLVAVAQSVAPRRGHAGHGGSSPCSSSTWETRTPRPCRP
jgi:hypothetical protein